MIAPTPASPRPPRLVLRFAVYTAIAFTLAAVGILWYVGRDAIARAEDRLSFHVEFVADSILSHQLLAADFQAPVPRERRAELDRLFERQVLDEDVPRVKLWAPDGTITYSNEHALIGTKLASEALARTMAGETLQDVTRLNEEGGAGENVEVFEVWTPVRLGDSSKIAGAFELYEEYEPVAAAARGAVTPVAVALGLALLLLYATLLPILRRVTKALAARNERLTEHAEALKRALEERREVERKLGHAERQYRTLIEQLPLVTYIDNLDETSSSVYMSPQAEELLGYPAVAWLGDPDFFPKVLHPEDRERVLARHNEAYAKGESFASEYRLVAKDGRVVWVEDQVMIARDPNGRPLHAQGFLVDVTERKRAEEELDRRHQELAALHETAVGMIDELDLDRLLELVARRAGALVGTEHCYVYLRDESEEAIRIRLGTGVFAARIGHALRKGEGLSGKVWESGEPLAVEDYGTWAGRSPALEDDTMRATVGVPLLAGREVVGVLGLAYSEEGRIFEDAEIALLSRFAHLASLALDNARLYSAARSSEESYRTLVSSVPGAIFRCAVDEGWTAEFLSDAVAEISGYPASDFIGNSVRSFATIIHPEDVERVAAVVGGGRAPYEVEYRILHADGSVRWVLERGQASGSGEGKLEGVIFDITERKAGEDERVMLAAIVESSDEAIMGASLDGRLTTWNGGAERMFGYGAEEAVGRPLTLLTPPEREGEALRIVAGVLQGEQITNYETVRMHKDGTRIEVSFTYSRILDAAGNTVGVSAICQDIGERRRAESALRESEAKFRAFVETTEEWVWAIDADWRLTYSNPAVERILGYTPDEIVGRDAPGLVHEDDRERLAQLGSQENTRRAGWSGVVLRWRHKDGSYRYLEANGTPILDEGGEPVGFRGTDRDVSGRIEAEVEREALLARAEKARAEAEAAQQDLAAQNDRLRELDTLKDEFMALVSHELRTPLTSIRGYTELLLEGSAGELTEEQDQFLRIVERNSQRLLRLVGDLLFLAQIEAGKLALEIGALDLGAVASESVEAARPAAEERRMTLTLATSPVPLLAADRARMGQLLDNLVSNAIKFTPEGGRVDVRLRALKGRAVLEVRDSGIGIPRSEQQFLFQRFFRSSTATERAIQGTGLGLAISKAIVEAHGGTITVQSAEGKGTTFRVSFPVRQPAVEADPQEAAL